MQLDQAALKALAIELSAAMPPPTASDYVELPAVDSSPRARALRRISEIVNARGWHTAVTRSLDRHGVSYVCDLPDDEVATLHERVEEYEDCVQRGFELQD